MQNMRPKRGTHRRVPCTVYLYPRVDRDLAPGRISQRSIYSPFAGCPAKRISVPPLFTAGKFAATLRFHPSRGTHLKSSYPTFNFAMITGGLISYGNRRNAILFGEIPNVTYSALAIGALVTILSFQLTALVSDLCFGIKRPFRAPISDLQTLLLIRKSSPMAVLNSLLRRDWLTRRYYRGEVPEGTQISREEGRVTLRVTLKLFFLLAAAPVISILTIAATLENEKSLTFEEARFGGLKFGVSSNLRDLAKSYRLTQKCRDYDIHSDFGDEPLVQFMSCRTRDAWQKVGGTTGIVSIGHVGNSRLLIFLVMGGWLRYGITTPRLVANGTSFLVKPGLTDGSAAALVNVGMDSLAAECTVASSSAQEIEFPNDKFNSSFKAVHTKQINCPGLLEGVEETELSQKSRKIVREMQDHLTYIEADRLEIHELGVANGSAKVSEPNKLPFLKRRRRNMSLALLGIVTAVVVALRVLAMVACNNDVGVGVELLVKERLGLGSCESMLQKGKGEVSYNNKFQLGKYVHYGLPPRGALGTIPAVENISGGTVGGELSDGSYDWEGSIK